MAEGIGLSRNCRFPENFHNIPPNAKCGSDVYNHTVFRSLANKVRVPRPERSWSRPVME